MLKRNYTILRGDPKNLTFTLTGDYSEEKIIFVVKADKVLTSDRLIQKRNTAAGGSDDELTAVYDDEKNKSTFTIKLEKIDTQDFTEEEYYYDITSQPADNSEDPITIASGNLEIEFDVQTDYDGTDLPEDATRYIPFILSDIGAGKVPRVLAGETEIEGIEVYTKTEIDNLLDLELDESAFATYFDTRLALKTLDNIAAGITNVHLTATLKSNYDSAYSASHSHSNKSTLDLIEQAFTTALKSTYDGYATGKQDTLGFTPENISNKGAVSGYCELDANQKIPTSRIPDSILGQVEYKGLWNATTNNPTLTNPDATAHGNYYIVSVAGTQFSIDFQIGDWVINTNGSWLKVDNTDAVSSVFGRTGAVAASNGDYTADQITETATRVFVTPTEKSNFNTAYGWGNHASAGYFVKASDTLDNITAGSTNVHLTATLKSNYDSAYSASHSHSNKSTLDAIEQAFTTALKSTYDGYATGKENTIASGTTAQYWRGDKSWQTLDKSAVGLGNVENTALSTWAGSTNITTIGTLTSATNINAVFSVGGTGTFSVNNSTGNVYMSGGINLGQNTLTPSSGVLKMKYGGAIHTRSRTSSTTAVQTLGFGTMFDDDFIEFGSNATLASYLAGFKFYPGTNDAKVTILQSGNVGIGLSTSISARAHIVSTTEQLRLGYDASNYLSATVNSTGNVTFALTGTTPKFTFSQGVIFGAIARLKNYTVATLPAGTQGDTAFVTDALAPTFLTAIVGGGAVVTPVFYDGTNWVAY